MTKRTLFVLASAATLTACDLKVSNPGPVNADFLNDKAALTAVVNGAGRDLSEAMNWIIYTSAAAAREIWPAGSTGSFGITVNVQNGRLTDDESGDFWQPAQRARWTAERGAVRLKDVLGDADYAKSASAAQILVWAGYANRLLGENMCTGVIDGGGPEDSKVYFTRADAAFTNAMAVATAAGNTTLAQAAQAGRASVRFSLGNTAGALSDAAAIPSTFSYKMPYYSTESALYNRIYYANANQPYRAHTQEYTWVKAYRALTKDARVPYDSSLTVRVGDGAVSNQPGGTSGTVRWYFQTKYAAQTSPVTLSSGWEMRLIEAEAKLIDGDIAGAVAIMNVRRAALAVPLVTATTAEDAWTALKRERAIELWLEARRLGDLRRWKTANRPGSYDSREDLTNRDLCWPVSIQEKAANPNFPK
ncbi:MAG: RagB/SusD family nutrient uptake outer membrane protein [Gemmatimonadetes bacterium]|nr:RagB/SusD family nutrient uptake outer membrane protein [Gemmatimonadota bacterium]